MTDLSQIPRILILEDEGLIALDIELTLQEAGVSETISVVTVEAALAQIERSPIGAAVIDINIGRSGWSYEVANRLRAKCIPFVFSTGSVEVADGFADVPLVMKPFSARQLVSALEQAVAAQSLAAAS